jgi:RluA family pseudouridine synthase
MKKTPKKYQPKGLSILYEDAEIIVVNKIEGLLTIGTDRERQKTAQSRLNNYVKKGSKQSRNRVFIVHRLDRDTSGVLIFAKNETAKHYLQENWKKFSKRYVTVVHGNFAEKEGIISSYLVENKMHRMYSSNDSDKGKYAKTGYKVIKESKRLSLLEIYLYTGRKHQIRVHLSEKGHPVAGDTIYGADRTAKRLALHSVSLTILHPTTQKEMSFETEIPLSLKSLVKL